MSYVGYLFGMTIPCFLLILNLHLRGRLQTQITNVISIIVLFMIGLSFFMFSWKTGLLTVFLAFLFLNLSMPIAAKVASKMLGYRTGLNSGYKENMNLEKMMRGDLSLDAYFKASHKEKESRAKRFKFILRNRNFSHIQKKHGITTENLEDYYLKLGVFGLRDLAWDILENPNELEKLIVLMNAEKTGPEIFSAFREL